MDFNFPTDINYLQLEDEETNRAFEALCNSVAEEYINSQGIPKAATRNEAELKKKNLTYTCDLTENSEELTPLQPEHFCTSSPALMPEQVEALDLSRAAFDGVNDSVACMEEMLPLDLCINRDKKSADSTEQKSKEIPMPTSSMSLNVDAQFVEHSRTISHAPLLPKDLPIKKRKYTASEETSEVTSSSKINKKKKSKNGRKKRRRWGKKIF